MDAPAELTIEQAAPDCANQSEAKFEDSEEVVFFPVVYPKKLQPISSLCQSALKRKSQLLARKFAPTERMFLDAHEEAMDACLGLVQPERSNQPATATSRFDNVADHFSLNIRQPKIAPVVTIS